MIANVPVQHIEVKVNHSETAIYNRNRPFFFYFFFYTGNKIIHSFIANNKGKSGDKAFSLARLISQWQTSTW